MPFQFLPLLATAANVLNIAGSVTSFLGQRRAASAASREGALMAEDALARGEFAAEQYGLDLARLLGTQRTQLAGQGVDLNQGTALALREQTEAIGAEDIATIRENARREAYALRRGYANQAAQLRAQSWGSLAGGVQSLGRLAASAWDVYQRGQANASVAGKTATMQGKLPTFGTP